MVQRLPQGRIWLPFALVMVFLATAFWFAAQKYIQRYGMPWHAVIGVYSGFLIMLVLVIAPGLDSIRGWIAGTLSNIWLYILLLCLPYLTYAIGTFDFRWAAAVRVLVIASASPLTYCFFPVKDSSRLGWQDVSVAIFLVASLMSHQLSGIWNIPVNLDFMGRLFLIAVSTWSWIFIRKLPGFGYDFGLTPGVLGTAALNFSLFAIIAIPASLTMGFTRWNPRPMTVVSFGLSYLEIFLFIALLEELVFRGFLQTLLSTTCDRA